MSSIYGNLKAKFVIISGGLLTTLRTYTLQNRSGTIALIDDIPTPRINAQAGNYTAVLADVNSVTIDMTSASANTFTIPTNASVAFPVGSSLTVFRSGAGVTTIQATTGVILNGTSGGSRLIEGQYQGVLLQKKATDTWYIFNK